ncbi:Multidrug resistance-associated protein 4 [Trachymyrmex septentrionalis]|uniref:Multidrug resistance-associated protein 4 n=1 Tax=Trachymyrmex septentrionalis TaxID=34720 RepID=A0A151JZ91_9HYME|nr:Multidrug resistance-associated protein 4 [Trachymyrmex septentrionalis]
MNQIGQIMYLLSNDVIRFDQLTMYLNYIWIMSFMFYFYSQTAIIGIIMWQKVGISYLIGIKTLLIIVLPGQETLSFLNLKLRTMIAPLTDRRVQLMSKFIARIQVVKMYAWEKYFTLITFVLMENNLTADVTYEMSTYFNILQLVVALYFPQGLILLGESIVSFNRLEDFLLMDEVNTRRFSENTPQLQFTSQKAKEETNAENQILVDSGQLLPTLRNINLTIKPGQLYAVVGAVGSGKSSVLHLLLKELNPGTGIANVCALSKDRFRQFPQGDMTMVGVRGVSLSDGQRERINLARAVYRQADVYLLDDPLSAVNTLEHSDTDDSNYVENSPKAEMSAHGRVALWMPYVYTFCIIACIATTLFRSFFYMKVSMDSSSNLHNIMFFKLLQARMSFFHNNSSGTLEVEKVCNFSKFLNLNISIEPRWKVEVVEFGYLYELLHDKRNGYFSQMVEKTGNQMAQSLLEQAKKAYEKNNDH